MAAKEPKSRPMLRKKVRFIEAYAGDLGKAAQAAGYTSKAATKRLMDDPQVCKAILERDRQLVGTEIANRVERQLFWSRVMRDEGETMPNRLKASENLGKSEGDFIQRHEVGGSDGGPMKLVIEWASSAS